MSEETLCRMATLAYECDDVALGALIIDIARAAERELTLSGFAKVFFKPEVVTYEHFLLRGVLPEMSRRLMEPSGITFMQRTGEKCFPQLTDASDQKLRSLSATCLEMTSLDQVRDDVRKASENDGLEEGKIIAVEAILQPVSSGNVIEIVASRLSPPVASRLAEDRFVAQLVSNDENLGAFSWTPDLTMKEEERLNMVNDAPEHSAF